MDGRRFLNIIRVQNEFHPEPGRSCRRLDDADRHTDPLANGKIERAGQSVKHQLWDLDEECHIEGETESEVAVVECCDARNRYCNRSRFSAHQRVCDPSLRLLGSLLSDDPYTHFHRANEMRTAAQRALFKQNSVRAVHAAGLARHRSQPRENINAGDTTMVWRKNNLTGRKGWTRIRCRGSSVAELSKNSGNGTVEKSPEKRT